MKVTVEFNLPEDYGTYNDFMDGAKWKYVVREIDEYMREIIKWNAGEYSEAQVTAVKEIRDMLVEYMDQENLKLHE